MFEPALVLKFVSVFYVIAKLKEGKGFRCLAVVFIWYTYFTAEGRSQRFVSLLNGHSIWQITMYLLRQLFLRQILSDEELV